MRPPPRPRRPSTDAERSLEWQIVRALLLFRGIHWIQLTASTAQLVGHVTHPARAGFLLAVLAGESTWFVSRAVRGRGYGGTPSAVVELTMGVVLLLGASVCLPEAGRSALAAPLVALATEFVTGAAIGTGAGASWRVLLMGTTAITGAHLWLFAGAGLGGLLAPDDVVGATGYAALALLFLVGTAYSLDVAREVAQMSRRLADESHRASIAVELHNHLGNTLKLLLSTRPDDASGWQRTQRSAAAAAERLSTFTRTGRFDAPTTPPEMLRRQVSLAAQDGLTVTLVAATSVIDGTVTTSSSDLDTMEAALRAALINVQRHARLDQAVLRSHVCHHDSGREQFEVSVNDSGPGMPAGAGPWRSLALHRDLLRDLGGDLIVESEPGHTEIPLCLPLAHDRPPSPAPTSREPAPSGEPR